ncbi:hypothetical protein CORC01_11167 [Colletotrichum orchidophilum]|uniref:Uncharacterized protein n=1 Tax=Colletotrichum orchidophilum TaxID=1209926 RepID=A0A1G4AWN0_9PEZI|nr:uncharacterized protein CORC01_11167 [Colletotrichum orchidophilum]OHE93570.1 hypothetical protein CORC01_11167 [Colletotrichum orchidophilum]
MTLAGRVLRRFVLVYPRLHLVGLSANHSPGNRGARDFSYPSCRATNNE